MKKITVVVILVVCLTVCAIGAVLGFTFYQLRLRPKLLTETREADMVATSDTEAGETSAQTFVPPPVVGTQPLHEPPELKTETAAEPTVPVSTGYRYVLSLFDGYVAVFSAARENETFIDLMEVTKTPASTLSADERQRLVAGIKIDDDEQLARILQDYGS